jgi:hypothetical protein
MDCYDLPSFNYFWNTEICVVPDAEGFCPPYQIVLDSDDGLFGGFSRLDHEAEYFTAVSLGSKYCAKSVFLILMSPANTK